MVVTLVLPHTASPHGRVYPSRDAASCPECGANRPVTTPEGFTVCSACGCEYPDSQPFVCTDPLGHDKAVIQSHMICRKGATTMIGTRAERAKYTKIAPNLEWAEKFGQTYEQEVCQRAYFEIKKVFTVLEQGDRALLFDAAMNGFVKVYKSVPKGARNRNVHLLALVTSYRVLRSAKVPILLKNYITTCLDKAQYTPRQFLTTLKDTTGAFPRTDPNEMIRFEVSALVSRLGIPKNIQDAVGVILKHHVGAFLSPKTAVRSAAIVCAAAIAMNNRANFPLSAIARAGGVATSAVIRCITDACARYHSPLGGSLVHAGDRLRSLFGTPGRAAEPETTSTRVLKTAVWEIAKQSNIPVPVARIAVSIASNHAGAFFQRSVKGSASAIIGTTVLATGNRKHIPLMTVVHGAGTNYPTMARYIAVACRRLGRPLPLKLAKAGHHLHTLFLDGPPGGYLMHQTGPPFVTRGDLPMASGLDGPPNAPPWARFSRALIAAPRKLVIGV